MRPSKLAGALLWMCCAQFFIAEHIVRSAWTLPYSFSTNFISDLGSTACDALVCSPWHTLMNASFALQGILIAGGALFRWGERRWLLRIAPILLVACGVGTFVVGLVPVNVSPVWHRAFAAMHFLGGGLGLIAFGLSIRKPLGWLAAAAGFMVLAATVFLGMGSDAPGVGTVERVAAYGIAACLTLMGGSSVRAYLIHRPDAWLTLVNASLSSLLQIR